MSVITYTKYLILDEMSELRCHVHLNNSAKSKDIPNPIIGVLAYLLFSLEGLWYGNGISILTEKQEDFHILYRDLKARSEMEPHLIDSLYEWDRIVDKYMNFWPCKTFEIKKETSDHNIGEFKDKTVIHRKIEKALKTTHDKNHDMSRDKVLTKKDNKKSVRFDDEESDYPDNVLKQIIPEKYPFDDDLRKHFEECVLDLTYRQKEVLYLRAKDKLSLNKIAEQLKLTRERVRQIQNNTLRILKRNLEAIVDGTSVDSIKSLKLSTRTYNALYRALYNEDLGTSIDDIEEYFKKHSPVDVRCMGVKSYAELREKFLEKTGRELPEKETNDE